jgi:SsrA-binding protein
MNNKNKKNHLSKPAKTITSDKVISVNRRARFQYNIIHSLEAGIALTGTEIKSVRTANVSLQFSFARITRSEAWLHGLNIPLYKQGNIHNHEPTRPRKLLLKRSQISDLEKQLKSANLTLIPLRLYITRHRAKIQIGLAQGRKLHDKRQLLAKRDSDRQIDRQLKERRY